MFNRSCIVLKYEYSQPKIWLRVTRMRFLAIKEYVKFFFTYLRTVIFASNRTRLGLLSHNMTSHYSLRQQKSIASKAENNPYDYFRFHRALSSRNVDFNIWVVFFLNWQVNFTFGVQRNGIFYFLTLKKLYRTDVEINAFRYVMYTRAASRTTKKSFICTALRSQRPG